jgi:LCP family protein required for cell wall assembly
MVMLPPDSGDAVMVSIPRDLYVRNPCTGTNTKINENLFGCGTVSGPEQLAIAIEDFTGVPIDHFASFTFPGFRKVIDRVGGIEVCVGDFPIRDLNEDFDDFQLPAGCSNVNGEQALSWVRSRHTEILTSTGWRGMPGVSDLTRNEHQQDMLLAALDKLKAVRSLPELQGIVEDLSDAVIIDDGLGLGDAIALLWDVRTISSDDIYRVHLDVRNASSEEAGSYLLLNFPFQDTLIAGYPKAYQFLSTD